MLKFLMPVILSLPESVHLTVDKAPGITNQPEDLHLCEGTQAIFSVIATGTPLNYKWYRNDIEIQGLNSSTLTIQSVVIPDDAGEYKCVVYNECGNVTSNVAILLIDTRMEIISELDPVEVCSGGKATFSIDATGTNLHYQWIKDHSVIYNTTNNVYTIDPVTSEDAGEYGVGVFNGCASIQGELMSNFVMLTVDSAPAITDNPIDLEVCNGDQAVFSVTATGSPLSYKWYINDIAIDGAVSSQFTVLNSQFSTDAGNYICMVYNNCDTVYSDAAVLTIDMPLSITQQPLSIEKCEGASATFSVTVEGSPASYQWYYTPSFEAPNHNPVGGQLGILIEGANASSYTIEGITSINAKNYYCVISNKCGSVHSDNANLTVDKSVEITQQPTAQEVCNGSQAVFSVIATGSPLYYQWYKNEEEIQGANESTYIIPSVVNITDAVLYKCKVYNDCGEVLSDAAVLTIDMPLSITQQPVSIEQCEGTDVTFSITAEGSPVSYQWFYNQPFNSPNHNPVGTPSGTKIIGAISSSFTIENITAADGKRYYCEISNACGRIISQTAVLKVDIEPAIILQVGDVEACSGTEVVFSVTATGTPLSYKWLYNGFEIPDATINTYTIASATDELAGEYSCMVYNLCDTVFSNIATLKINELPLITKNIPESANLCSDAQLTLTIEATGTALTYHWTRTNGNIDDIDNSYTVTEPDSYQCIVSNMCSAQLSNVTVVKAASKPLIINSPLSLEQCEGTSVNGTIVATGTEPIAYQWFKDGSQLNGYTESSYTINSINKFYNGDYYCVVSNECGSVTTEPATLTVDLKPTIDTQPVGGIGCRKNDFTFTVEASGFEDLTYQWFKDVNMIEDATDTSFNISNLNSDNSGDYYVVVTNSCGSVTSDIVTLTVTNDTKPEITNQPDAFETCEGNSATFTVEASGSDTFDYTWYFNGTAIEGANGPVYTIESIDISNQGDYYCVLSNYCGSTTSDTAALTVDLSPVFISQPISATKCLNGVFTVRVEVSGATPFKYKWYKNAVGISGATNATYFINNLTLDNVGDYNCVVTNDCNTVISDVAHLSVVEPISITLQPVNVQKCEGTSASFAVEVSGANPFYQWYKGDVLIEGANSNTLNIPSVSISDAGGYVCIINGCNSVISNPAILTVGTAPAITAQPVSAITCPEIEHTFNIVATGEGLTYQWYNENGIIDGAVSESYLTAIVGTYYCVVKGTCGEDVKSNEVTLTLNSQPIILNEPVSGSTCPEVPYNFTVLADGSELTYQWFNADGIILDATNTTYSTASEGSYYCVVSGLCGTPVTSDVATLTLKAKPAITLQPAGDSKCVDTDFNMTIDATGTAPLTINWYHDGLIIEDAAGSTTYGFTIDGPEFAGDYTVVVSNSCGSETSNAATLIVKTPPSLVNAPSIDTRILGSAIEYSLTPSGTAPFNYQWLLDNVEIEGATADNYNLTSINYQDSGVYSSYINNVCGDITVPVATLIVKDSAHYNLSGTFTYDNTAASPIKNTVLNLKTLEDVVAYTTQTDESGAYSFNKVLNGSYVIEPVITNKWNGGNPTDALLIMSNFLGLYEFADALKVRAADVNYDFDITLNDALYINKRFVRVLNHFEPVDWVYENDVLNLNSDLTHNFKALCVGDVDGSNKMTGSKAMFNSIPSEGSVKAKSGQMFDVSVSIANDYKLGAIGLKIMYNNSGIKVYDVVSDISGLENTVTDNEVNIGWASTRGISLKQGESFITLKCMLTSDAADLDNLFVLNSESVLSDTKLNQIDIKDIRVSKVMHEENKAFTFSSYPNPFVSNTTLNYYLPTDSDVKVVVTDVLGKEVAVLYNGSQSKGMHNLAFDASALLKGVYLYTITAGSHTGTGKLIKAK